MHYRDNWSNSLKTISDFPFMIKCPKWIWTTFIWQLKDSKYGVSVSYWIYWKHVLCKFYANLLDTISIFWKISGIKCKFSVYFPISSGFNLNLLVIYSVPEEFGNSKNAINNFNLIAIFLVGYYKNGRQ